MGDSFAGIYRNQINQIKGLPKLLLLDLITSCNFCDNPDFRFDNYLYPLKRGQLVTSLNELSRSTDLSIQQIRTILKKLTKLQILTDTSTGILTNKARLITIVDIDEWLVKQGELADTSTDTPTNYQQTPNRRLTTNNNDNKDNKENNDKKYKTISNFLKDKEIIIIKVTEMYKTKDVNKAWIDFEGFINSKTTKYKDFLMAFQNWVREDRFVKYNLNHNNLNKIEKKLEDSNETRKNAEMLYSVFRTRYLNKKLGENKWIFSKDYEINKKEIIEKFKTFHPKEFSLVFNDN